MLNVPCPISLREHLLTQLGELALTDRDRAVVSLLIEELDDDGYLPLGLDELAGNLPLELELDSDELAVGLAQLQQFDPAGVGARSLAESLTLQLRRLPGDEPGHALALAIVREHLALLGGRDYARLKKLLRCDDAALRDAQALIARLNPHPATGFGHGDVHYVIPDISVRKLRGRWTAELNRARCPPAGQPAVRTNAGRPPRRRRNVGPSAGGALAGQEHPAAI
ncbi:RNA polymerase factor sigma-54 [Chromobacterium violaceum]|uniref:RNA polymerase factor sigma-54 n=1 Tax=Chromobacterium violaceum TaxID=536 RepID=A0A447THS5_CHRVL|nr:RNA polymerase factor sigma-54 [Chromobacterium violaceum]